MPNDTLAAPIPRPDNISLFPSRGVHKQEQEHRPSWIFRRLADLGVIGMTNTRAKGWHINPTTITTLIAILLFFGGICAWLWNVAYTQGSKDAEMKQRDAQIEQLQKEVKQAKDLQLYNQSANEEKQKKEKK